MVQIKICPRNDPHIQKIRCSRYWCEEKKIPRNTHREIDGKDPDKEKKMPKKRHLYRKNMTKKRLTHREKTALGMALVQTNKYPRNDRIDTQETAN